MKISELHIQNFKSIHDMHIPDIENALILVGQNNTGKTTVLDAVRAAGGGYQISPEDFGEAGTKIRIQVTLSFTEEDLEQLRRRGVVSQYRKKEAWMQDFCQKLPSYHGGRLTFTMTANRDGRVRYQDGVNKNNSYIKEVFPPIYHVDTERRLEQLQSDMLLLQENEILKRMRSGCCMFNQARECNHCFHCIGLIEQKSPAQMDALEVSKLLDYKLYQLNLDTFARMVNDCFHKNGGRESILYSMNRDVEKILEVTTEIRHPAQNVPRPISHMGKGMRSIYLFSLLEAYTQIEETLPSIIMIEDPEIFLHPSLQKMCGTILYRLAAKNQVIFTTHSPNLANQLCLYYEERNREDMDKLPKVRPENVLILKYYSFENYFLNPGVMVQLGIVESEEVFYRTILEKWKEYLRRLKSGRHLTEILGRELETVEDVRLHMEEIRTYLRGHNLFDIFYGRFREQETELLERYIDLAPREDFGDIFDALERFPYFESRRSEACMHAM